MLFKTFFQGRSSSFWGFTCPNFSLTAFVKSAINLCIFKVLVVPVNYIWVYLGIVYMHVFLSTFYRFKLEKIPIKCSSLQPLIIIMLYTLGKYIGPGVYMRLIAVQYVLWVYLNNICQ